MNNIIKSGEYNSWLKELKVKFQQAQIKASVQVNTTLLKFYWDLGNEIIDKQKNNNWGSGFLKQLSHDLITEFPDIKGFSETNLSYIRRWVSFYNCEQNNIATTCGENQKSISPQLVPQLVIIPWGHNRTIISKCKDTNEALFYVNKTIENGWSRSLLVHQIESKQI